MTIEDVSRLVTKLLTEEFEIPEQKIKSDSHLYRDLGLDSIDALDMVGALEAEYNLAINVTDLKSIRTVQDVVDFVVRVIPESVDHPA